MITEESPSTYNLKIFPWNFYDPKIPCPGIRQGPGIHYLEESPGACSGCDIITNKKRSTLLGRPQIKGPQD